MACSERKNFLLDYFVGHKHVECLVANTIFVLQIVLYATVTNVPMTQCKRYCTITCYLSENCASKKLQMDSGYSLIYGTSLVFFLLLNMSVLNETEPRR